MKILFVASRFGNHRAGGHILSAASLAKALLNLGHQVHFAINSRNLPDYLRSSGVQCLYVSVANVRWSIMRLVMGYWSRSLPLLSLARKEKYDLIVAMDSLAAWHASVPACLLNIPMLPVVAGGSNVEGAFPHSLTVVFSAENRESLLRLGWDPESVVVSEGRIDFTEFLPKDRNGEVSKPVFLRLLYLSRLDRSKRPAFEGFVRELENLSNVDVGVQEIIVDIAGDGPDREKWVQHLAQASIAPNIRVQFLGYRHVTGHFLRQYDLVVTMGRGILEALASGVPAAIAGPEGYKGLVREENFARFAPSNFTGRGTVGLGNLARDLKTLLSVDRLEHLSGRNLRSYVIERYSSESGAETLLHCLNVMGERLIPAGGRFLRLMKWHVRSVFRRSLKAFKGRLRPLGTDDNWPMKLRS